MGVYANLRNDFLREKELLGLEVSTQRDHTSQFFSWYDARTCVKEREGGKRTPNHPSKGLVEEGKSGSGKE